MENLFKTIWYSCTSFAFYRKVIGLSFLQCLKYIVPFCLIIGAILYINPGIELIKTSRQLQEWADENLPEIRIEDGILTIDAPQPCYLEPAGILVPVGKEGETRNLKLAFDTTGELESIDAADNADVLFLKDKMIARDPAGEVEEIPLKKLWLFAKYPKITINKEIVKRYLPKVAWAMAIFPFILTIIAKPIQALIYSLIGMIAATREKKSIINFKGVFNICLFATIPATIVSTIVHLSGLFFPYLWILYSFVAVAFIIGAISNIKQQV